MKKVLFIAYYFPPIGGSGTQRPVKFVKYLPEFGWQPYVISTDRPYGDGAEGRDETLLADIPPGVQVWRVPTPQPQPVNRLAHWVGWKSAAVSAEPGSAAGRAASHPPAVLPWTTRLRRAALAPLYLVQDPLLDPALYWSLHIVPLARRIIREEQIDVVLTTSAPWSALITGTLLRRLTARPWIADFRDLWTEDPLVYQSTPIRKKLDVQAECRLITQADAVISVTEPLIEKLRKKTRRPNQPFILIPNGWDREDFPDLPAQRTVAPPPETPEQCIALLHPGSTYQGEPLPLLAALDRLAADGVALDRLRFHFVGYMHPQDQAHIANSPHSRLFQLDAQRVPHDAALRLMRNAHVLLLLLRRGPDLSSGKVFEYMVAGRPVLTIGARNGVAGQLVQECGIGAVVDPEDVGGLARALQQITVNYPEFVESYYAPNRTAIDGYSRRTLTSRLAATLDEVS